MPDFKLTPALWRSQFHDPGIIDFTLTLGCRLNRAGLTSRTGIVPPKRDRLFQWSGVNAVFRRQCLQAGNSVQLTNQLFAAVAVQIPISIGCIPSCCSALPFGSQLTFGEARITAMLVC